LAVGLSKLAQFQKEDYNNKASLIRKNGLAFFLREVMDFFYFPIQEIQIQLSRVFGEEWDKNKVEKNRS
jgi:hypothetical protein